VRERPHAEARTIGYLRAGSGVEIVEGPVGTAGCPGGFHSIKPAGFVCVAEGNATLDPGHDMVRALSAGPDFTRPLPYIYGIVRKPGPIYGKLPTREQAEANEQGLDQRMKEWLGAEGENGASFRADLWLRAKGGQGSPPAEAWEGRVTEGVPAFLAAGRAPPWNLAGLPPSSDPLVVGKAKHHNGFAFLDTALIEGRRYAISTQLLVLPVDRLRPIEGSTYKGYEIPRDIELPCALIRRDGAHADREEKGKLVKGKDLPRRSAVKLTGKQKFFGESLHFETSDGLWVSDRFASRIDPAKKMPKWGKKGERWIDVNVTKQTLVAYDGRVPVYATVVSTGEAGLGDPEKTRATKRGIFRIHTKHVTATMDSDIVGEEFELRDIPYVQYFEGGYALHAAYWHDDFGTPRSHGCINLSPADAKWLFEFTEPHLPEGWHGVKRPLTGSVVFVHP
jgi:hypothetical protein